MKLLYKIFSWSQKHQRLVKVLWCLFFPITFPCELIALALVNRVFFHNLDKVIESKNENAIFAMCCVYLKSVYELNKWKGKYSKRWFEKSFANHEKKIYNYAIIDKEKIDFQFFRNIVSAYLKYNILGGTVVNNHENATITVS